MTHLLCATIAAASGGLLLAFGWREVFRTSLGHHPTGDERNWLFGVLFMLVVAAAPLLPVVIARGMHRYAHVPFVPWVIPLKR